MKTKWFRTNASTQWNKKDIKKVIKSLENKEIFLESTTRKTTSQETTFLRPLMTVGLTLIEKSTYTIS